jgi:hypothetical protein
MVPYSVLQTYLDHVHTSRIPTYRAAAGLVSVSVCQRPVVSYVELLTLTLWQSEQALSKFLEGDLAAANDRNENDVIHMEAHVYELLVTRQGNG